MSDLAPELLSKLPTVPTTSPSFFLSPLAPPPGFSLHVTTIGVCGVTIVAKYGMRLR